MILTEKEARLCWCPFARIRDIRDVREKVAVSYNRTDVGVTPASRCIASDCMAWAWVGGPEEADRFGKCGLTDGGTR